MTYKPGAGEGGLGPRCGAIFRGRLWKNGRAAVILASYGLPASNSTFKTETARQMETNRKILIVDDQKDLREQLAKLLKRSGKRNETASLVQLMRQKMMGKGGEEDPEYDDEPTYVVDVAGQGEEGYTMVRQAAEANDPYAIVFLDMRMPPGWDGLETAKKIREADKDIEIVIMTAYADHDQRTIADAVGMPEKLLYIKKPFQTEEIFQLALSLTSKWSLEKRDGNKRRWLEALARCMSRIQYTCVFDCEDFFKAVLRSLCDFLEAQQGFIAQKAEGEDGAWKSSAAAAPSSRPRPRSSSWKTARAWLAPWPPRASRANTCCP